MEGWHITRFYRDPVAKGSSPSAVMVNSDPNVFFSDKEDNGEISDWAWSSSTGWQIAFTRMNSSLGQAPARSSSTVPEVFFSDNNDNGTLSYWTYNATEGWHLTRLYWDQLAAGSSPAAIE